MLQVSDLSLPASSLAGLVTALLANPDRPDPSRLPRTPEHGTSARADGRQAPASSAPPRFDRPIGLGGSAARLSAQTAPAAPHPAVARPGAPELPGRPSGLGTAAWRVAGDAASASAADARPTAGDEADASTPELFCPGAVRDDPALGEEVNGRLVAWAGEVGIYSGPARPPPRLQLRPPDHAHAPRHRRSRPPAGGGEVRRRGVGGGRLLRGRGRARCRPEHGRLAAGPAPRRGRSGPPSGTDTRPQLDAYRRERSRSRPRSAARWSTLPITLRRPRWGGSSIRWGSCSSPGPRRPTGTGTGGRRRCGSTWCSGTSTATCRR